MFRMYYFIQKNTFLKLTTFNRARQKIKICPKRQSGALTKLQYKG